MRIAVLQFTPMFGDVQGSIAHAESLLYKDESRLESLEILVLPELAFTGMSAFLLSHCSTTNFVVPNVVSGPYVS